jgi:hypothetical protein
MVNGHSLEDFEFLIFSHAFDGPDLYGALIFFETIPSSRNWQTAANMSQKFSHRCVELHIWVG